MTCVQDYKVHSIVPATWIGLDVFYVAADEEGDVPLRLDNDVWRACSSATQVFEGGRFVARKNIDLIEAGERALALGRGSVLLRQLEEERTAAKYVLRSVGSISSNAAPADGAP